MRLEIMSGLWNPSVAGRGVPLPLGEGAAKRRVRAKDRPSSGPSGHLLPEGEGLATPTSSNLPPISRPGPDIPLIACGFLPRLLGRTIHKTGVRQHALYL